MPKLKDTREDRAGHVVALDIRKMPGSATTFIVPSQHAVGKSYRVQAHGTDPPTGCTCPDWAARGNHGTGTIKQCKHMIAYTIWAGIIVTE